MVPAMAVRWIRPVVAVIGVALAVWALDYLIARPIPLVDVSAQPQYSTILGKRFRTQRDLLAIGYTVDRDYKKQIDYVTLVLPPGFSGPEVVARGELPKGSVLEVIGVLKGDTSLMTRISYLVSRVGAAPPMDGRMILDVDHESTRNFGLDEMVFVPVQ